MASSDVGDGPRRKGDATRRHAWRSARSRRARSPTQADTPVSLTQSSEIIKLLFGSNHREGRSPHTRNRSLILHGVAEQNGVSIPERGRHHPSGIAAPRRAELASGRVCRFFVMSFFVTNPQRNARNHLTSGHRLAPEKEGSARGRLPHKNSHLPRPRFMLRECQCAQSLLCAGRAGMMPPPGGVV